MILKKMYMHKLPESCLECEDNYLCVLPGKVSIGKPYLTKRHRNCPLIEVADELIGQQEAMKKDLTGGNRRRSK